MFASTGRLVLTSRSCLLEAAGKSNARHAMTKPEIIGSIRSTYTRVVCMVCEEKGIEYVLTETPLRAPEIFAIHPFGKMPVLRHGDFVVFESKAIADYLDRSFPAPYVFPSEPRLAALPKKGFSLVTPQAAATLTGPFLTPYSARKRSMEDLTGRL